MNIQPSFALGSVVALWILAGLDLASAFSAVGPPPPLPAITGRVAMTREQFARARQVLGDHGCLAVRSAARWNTVEELLASLGWKPPAGEALGGLDFDKKMLVLVYKNGDERDQFSLRRYANRDKTPALEILMSYIIYKQRAEIVNRCNFILVTVPRLPRLEVSVSTFHPFNGGPNPSSDQGQLEWRGVVGTAAGDVADGLRAAIAAKETTVAPGGDILVKFTLEYANGDQVKWGPFAGRPEPVRVWDGKYSNGYRNHAFEVRTPDGKVHLLRPREILNWDKNVPHLVEVKDGQPYVLPEWAEGQQCKSLKALGLDISRPGRYTITGIYAETGGKTQVNGTEQTIWGGNIGSNTVTVEVAAH